MRTPYLLFIYSKIMLWFCQRVPYLQTVKHTQILKFYFNQFSALELLYFYGILEEMPVKRKNRKCVILYKMYILNKPCFIWKIKQCIPSEIQPSKYFLLAQKHILKNAKQIIITSEI